MFEINQKIICIDAKPRRKDKFEGVQPITKGQVYTVREVFKTDLGNWGVKLMEIINPKHPRADCEWAYFADRFAPIRTTSIDVFLKMLEPVPTRSSTPTPEQVR